MKKKPRKSTPDSLEPYFFLLSRPFVEDLIVMGSDFWVVEFSRKIDFYSAESELTIFRESWIEQVRSNPNGV